MASGVAVIKVGAATEIEMIEKKHRIDDAIEAVKAATIEGIIPGGGSALLRAVSAVEYDKLEGDKLLGYAAVLKACNAPLRQMAVNAGQSPDIVVQTVEAATGNHGWNFIDGEIEDLIEAGIVDPVKVTRCALQNAASAAGTLITTGHAIVEVA